MPGSFAFTTTPLSELTHHFAALRRAGSLPQLNGNAVREKADTAVTQSRLHATGVTTASSLATIEGTGQRRRCCLTRSIQDVACVAPGPRHHVRITGIRTVQSNESAGPAPPGKSASIQTLTLTNLRNHQRAGQAVRDVPKSHR